MPPGNKLYRQTLQTFIDDKEYLEAIEWLRYGLEYHSIVKSSTILPIIIALFEVNLGESARIVLANLEHTVTLAISSEECYEGSEEMMVWFMNANKLPNSFPLLLTGMFRSSMHFDQNWLEKDLVRLLKLVVMILKEEVNQYQGKRFSLRHIDPILKIIFPVVRMNNPPGYLECFVLILEQFVILTLNGALATSFDCLVDKYSEYGGEIVQNMCSTLMLGCQFDQANSMKWRIRLIDVMLWKYTQVHCTGLTLSNEATPSLAKLIMYGDYFSFKWKPSPTCNFQQLISCYLYLCLIYTTHLEAVNEGANEENLKKKLENSLINLGQKEEYLKRDISMILLLKMLQKRNKEV